MLKRRNYLGLLGVGIGFWTLSAGFSIQETASDPVTLQDLTAFNQPGKSWQMAGNVYGNISEKNELAVSSGSGILVNNPSRRVKGEDLFTKAELGDIELELDYLLPSNGNSGIYLQGRYEVQLFDSWEENQITSASNGGIYNVVPPRVNASKAPGLWQNLKIGFQAPRFDASGNKTENARLLYVLINGVLVQENVELAGPTQGAISKDEVAKAPLRIQGDHGAVALRNITINELDNKADGNNNNRNAKDPILLDAPVTTILRSFMNLDNREKSVHAVSVGSPQGVHYTYDMDYGALVQVWRGDFLDTTPMWDGRGNGTSTPRGAVQRFGKPVLSLAKLADNQSAWPVDTAGTQFRQKGYAVNADNQPTFKYLIYGTEVEDFVQARNDGKGFNRIIRVKDADGLSLRLASASKIEETSRGSYIIGDKEYYLNLDNAKSNKPFIRNVDGGQELIVPVRGEISYTILF